MMKIILPVILLLAGVGGGVGAAWFLFPAPDPEAVAAAERNDCIPADTAEMAAIAAPAPPTAAPTAPIDPEPRDYARLANQFVVPIIRDGKVTAMVVLTLSIEVTQGRQESVFAQEPKLRDQFLQVLFDHANTGGFDGAFTASGTMRSLRTALRRVAQNTVGSDVHDVLILDLIRQEV